MTKNELDIFLKTQIRQPIPGEPTFDADDQIAPERLDGFKERFWPGRNVSVQETIA